MQLFYIAHDIWKLWWTFLDKVQKYSNFKLSSLIERQKSWKNMVMWYTPPFQMHKFYSNFGTFDVIMWLNILFETNTHSNCHDFNLDVQPTLSIDNNASFMGWRKTPCFLSSLSHKRGQKCGCKRKKIFNFLIKLFIVVIGLPRKSWRSI